MTTSAIRHRRS